MANVKLAYGSAAALTLTLDSLASDTNLLAGRASTVIDNTSNLYTDYLIGGKITTGTSPTAARLIEVWAYASIDDTPTYPDGITGSDANKTMNAANKVAALRLLAVIDTASTSNITYWFGPVSIAQAFGSVPKKFGVFVVHNTGVNLHATGSNHALTVTPVYATVG